MAWKSFSDDKLLLRRLRPLLTHSLTHSLIRLTHTSLTHTSHVHRRTSHPLVALVLLVVWRRARPDAAGWSQRVAGTFCVPLLLRFAVNVSSSRHVIVLRSVM